MRCLVDTNILISDALFPDSVPARAFMKAVSPPHGAVICDCSLDEMRRVYNRKFLHKIPDFERFLSLLTLSVEIVSAPEETRGDPREEQKLRDPNDRPIYRAALAAGVDGILTGDKDFLDSGIVYPKMITAVEFVRMD